MRPSRPVHRRRAFAILLGGAAAAALVRRRVHARGRAAPGGVLIGDARAYDSLSHPLLLGRLYAGIARDVAGVARPGLRLLEVGCGPGRLSLLLAERHGLEVTGLDLDPAMIERAISNARRLGAASGRTPTFLVGDAASLPFPDASFDLVLSTLSVHHWADPGTGLAEMARVLRPGGRALLWDVRRGVVPLHRHVADPIKLVHASPLQVVAVAPWRWPWRISWLVRIELIRPPASATA